MVEADSSSDLEVEERGWELRNDVVGDRIEVGWLLVEVDGVVGLVLGVVFRLLLVAFCQPGLVVFHNEKDLPRRQTSQPRL
jgi:hypothetical protein